MKPKALRNQLLMAFGAHLSQAVARCHSLAADSVGTTDIMVQIHTYFPNVQSCRWTFFDGEKNDI